MSGNNSQSIDKEISPIGFNEWGQHDQPDLSIYQFDLPIHKPGARGSDFSNDQQARSALDSVKHPHVSKPVFKLPQNMDQWGHYIAGYLEGNGHISINKWKLTLHTKELAFARLIVEYIRSITGIVTSARLNEKHSTNSVTVEFQQPGIDALISLINGKLRSQYRLSQLRHYVTNSTSRFSESELLGLDTSSLFSNHWFAGFTDADLSFTIDVSLHHEGKYDNVPSGKFERYQSSHIILSASADNSYSSWSQLPKTSLSIQIGLGPKMKDIIYFIARSFGVDPKRIRFSDKVSAGLLGKGKLYSAYSLTLKSRLDLSNAIQYYDQFNLLTGKNIDYQTWKLCATFRNSPIGTSFPSSVGAVKCKLAMNDLRNISTTFSHTQYNDNNNNIDLYNQGLSAKENALNTAFNQHRSSGGRRGFFKFKDEFYNSYTDLGTK